MTKLRQCRSPVLDSTSKRMISALEVTSQWVEGTHEVRRLMRYALHAYRIVYGAPIFVTFAPNEKDSLLMIRLSRTRENDPVWSAGRVRAAPSPLKRWASRNAPSLDCATAGVSLEQLAGHIPSYEQRRAILARDPLCCSDGIVCLRFATSSAFEFAHCAPTATRAEVLPLDVQTFLEAMQALSEACSAAWTLCSVPSKHRRLAPCTCMPKSL